MGSVDAQSFPISFPVSGVTDSEGNAQITVPGFIPALAAAWNLYMNLPGNAPQVQLFQGAGIGGIPIGSAGAVNGQLQVGPVYSYGSAQITIHITGADPNLPIQGMISGLQSSDPGDLSSISGQSSQTVGNVTAYDGQTILNELGVTHTADVTYPTDGGVFDVRLWASILVGLRMTTSGTGASFLMTFRWFANEDGSRLVGQRALILDDNVGTAVATMLNLGPYLQVVVNKFVNWTWNASILTSNRQTSDVFGGNFNPYLTDDTSVTVGAGNTVIRYFETLYGGPVWLSQRTPGGANGTFRVSAMDSTGVYRAGNVWNNAVPGGTNDYARIVCPASPCRVEIVNTSAGSSTYSAYTYASETGGT